MVPFPNLTLWFVVQLYFLISPVTSYISFFFLARDPRHLSNTENEAPMSIKKFTGCPPIETVIIGSHKPNLKEPWPHILTKSELVLAEEHPPMVREGLPVSIGSIHFSSASILCSKQMDLFKETFSFCCMRLAQD